VRASPVETPPLSVVVAVVDALQAQAAVGSGGRLAALSGTGLPVVVAAAV